MLPDVGLYLDVEHAAPSNSARPASPRRMFCAKSTRPQQFSPRYGWSGRITGTATWLQGGVDERCSVGEAAPSTGPQESEAGQVQAFVGVDLSEADDSV